MKKLLQCIALLTVLSVLFALSVFAAAPGDYGYYDVNGDGRIEITDVLTILRALLNDPEPDSNLLRVLRTAKTTTTSEPVDTVLISVDTENETVVLSGEHLDSFTVPFATLGLTADTDFDALLGESVTLTVPSPAEKFFADYDADKLLAGRPVPLIDTEEPETPEAPAVQDITFSPNNAYLKFTITPPADETGIAKYEIRIFEEGNDAGRIGWPVNAEYCEYIGLERFKPEVDYDTVTVYAYDADGTVLSEYTENLAITHTDATVTITGAYVENLADYGGVFFSEPLSSSYALTFFDADGNKMAFQNWLDAGSTVSDLYEYENYSLRDVASVEIASSRSVAVTEADGISNLNITTVGSNRVTVTEYPDAMRLGAASNPHINKFDCLAWDEPADQPDGYSRLYLHTTDGTWTEIGYIDGGMYSLNALPTGTYDKIRIYTVPAWEIQASYGYGIFEADYALTVGGGSTGEEEDGNVLPAVSDVSFTEDSYWGLRVTFTEPSSNFSPEYHLYLYNGTDWVGPLAKSYSDYFDLAETDLTSGTYTKLRIVSTTTRDGYTDGVYEADCSLTVDVTESSASLRFVCLSGDEYFSYASGLPASTNFSVYWSATPSMLDSNRMWGLYTDSTGACINQYGDVDFDTYYRIVSKSTCTITDAATATFAYTAYSAWTKPTVTVPTADNSFITAVGFMAVNNTPAFAFTPASSENWWQSAVSFSADGGETWVGQNIRSSTSVALSNRNWLEIEETTTYNKVRVTAFANGSVKEYVADCSFTVTDAGTLTLPAPKIVYNELNAAYNVVFEGSCPANTGYIYTCLNSWGSGSSGSGTNNSDSATDIIVSAYLNSAEDFADYTVRVRLLDNVAMDGMTASVSVYDSGEIPVYTAE